MFCTECGAQVPDNFDFCNSCGADLTALKKANAEIQANESKSSENIEDIAAAAAAAAKAAAGADAGFSDLDDSESGTTVLTEDMSGPLKISDALTSPNPPVQPAPGPGPQPQPQVQKVVTPAPVTNSTILNSDIPPVGQQMNPYQQFPPQGGFQPASIPKEYNPISPWGYLGYSILLAIPLVGLILMFVWGFGENTNKNLKNYARFYLICLLIGIVVAIVVIVLCIITGATILSNILDLLH